jgi:hypothetical protein
MHRTSAIVFTAVFLLAGIAGWQWATQRTARQAEAEEAMRAAEATPADAVAGPIPEPLTALPAPGETLEFRRAGQNPSEAFPQTKAASKKRSSPAGSAPAPNAQEPIRDPVARVALYFVGLDPAAEEYWLDAINDPSLSAHEREDLIEDLNEEGLPDPKNPSEDDLPLIVRRLQLIEAVGEDAMDEANAAAFREAYKDLVNLAEVATGGGQSVR